MLKTGKKTTLIVYGPTASGKTSFAIEVARTLKSLDKEIKPVILNADSLQIYKGLPILTACPTREEYEAIPHHHFEMIDPNDQMSVVKWWRFTTEFIKNADHSVFPIIVGGTGFYLKSLIEGLPPTPKADIAVRDALEKHCNKIGQEAFYKILQEKDPDMAQQLEPMDRQRVLRAMEVLDSTGKSLLWWQEQPFIKPDFELDIHYVQLSPEREWLYERCNRRFDLMVGAATSEETVLSEIDGFIDKYGSDNFDLCRKAIGFDELLSYKRGEVSLEDAVDKAKQRTRNYAKRQLSWSRSQMNFSDQVESWYSWHQNDYQDNAKIDQFIKTDLLRGL